MAAGVKHSRQVKGDCWETCSQFFEALAHSYFRLSYFILDISRFWPYYFFFPITDQDYQIQQLSLVAFNVSVMCVDLWKS